MFLVVKRLSFVVLMATILVASACGGSPNAPTPTPTGSFVVSPTAITAPPGGGSGVITVTATGTNTTVAWTASSTISWITITAGSSGIGSGSVSYTTAANASGAARTGTFPAAGQMVTVSQAVPVADTSGLSADVRAYIMSAPYTMQSTRIQRMDKASPVRVYPGPYSPELVLRAANFWTADTGLTFTLVGTEAEANISIANVFVPVGCGDAGIDPSSLPIILGGKVRIAVGLKPGCVDQGDNIEGGISHEIGHILGFGHSQVDDLMNAFPGFLKLLPTTATAVRWVYSQPIGAVIK